MKTISVVITSRDGRYHLEPSAFPTHELALRHAQSQFVDTATVYSYCFNNLKQAREYVRCRNRSWDCSAAFGHALGQPNGSLRFAVVPHVNFKGYRVMCFNTHLGTVKTTRDDAEMLCGALRLHQVNNDAKWETLPQSIRDKWLEVTSTSRPHFELSEKIHAQE